MMKYLVENKKSVYFCVVMENIIFLYKILESL